MSKELLIGLTGPAGCGKDSVASIMAREGFFRYALALPLKLGLEAMFDIPLSVWSDREAKEREIPWIGKSPRQLAQTLGTEWGRQTVHQQIWVNRMLRSWDEVRLRGCPRMVVTDVRFDNEATAIINAGGTVWRVEREGVAPVAEHVSESGVSPALIKGVVKNSSDLDGLDVVVSHWIPFLMKRYAK